MEFLQIPPAADEIEYVGRIRSQYSSLSKSQKRIANYIMQHQEEVSHYSITTLAKKTGSTPSTVTRLCQALSYSGFSELKVYISKNLLSSAAFLSPIQPEDNSSVILQKLMNNTQDAITETLRTLDAEVLQQTVDAIVSARAIVFFGQSSSYISALYGQTMLMRAGILSEAVKGNVDLETAASAMRPGDVAIGIGYSGEAKSVMQALTVARQNGAKVIAVTALPSSSFARIAHHTLFYSHNIPDSIQYLHLASMCEVAVLGAIQASILSRPSQGKQIENVKQAILHGRIK